MPVARWTLPTLPPFDDRPLAQRLQRHLDGLTKPLGALGQIEALAVQLALVQGREPEALPVSLRQPQLLVFAADHGIAAEGVSAYPQAVTAQMAQNMAAGGAAINVLARQHGFAMTLVDAGIATDPGWIDGAMSAAGVRLRARRLGAGTANGCQGPAMTPEQAETALGEGAALVRELPGEVLALGEMGIANTSSAALLAALLLERPVRELAGRGTGLDDARLVHKVAVLERAQRLHAAARAPLAVLQAVGGFEIGMMAGAMLQAASERRVVLVDGFIASAAALLACRLSASCAGALVFCHRSQEAGHARLLEELLRRPAPLPTRALLDLDLRLGEGSGALLAWPLVVSAARLSSEMASFASAGVSGAQP